jgi:hypothetical protein
MRRRITTRSISAITRSTAQAVAHPLAPTTANAAAPPANHINPHTLSHNRARSALRAVTGSLPVRIAITSPSSVQPQGEP